MRQAKIAQQPSSRSSTTKLEKINDTKARLQRSLLTQSPLADHAKCVYRCLQMIESFLRTTFSFPPVFLTDWIAMSLDAAPFECLTFSISKPKTKTSSLVIALTAPDTYELRLKRIENGTALFDETRPYESTAAASLDGWIRALGFYDDEDPAEHLPAQGAWSLIIDRTDSPLHRGGSHVPAALTDLLTTMIGLGLPGFEHIDAGSFFADFDEPINSSPTPTHASALSGMPALPSLPGGLDASGLADILAQLEKNPEQAEAALREQAKNLPTSLKQQLLDFARTNDPEHYDWWRRILLG